jgi:hypothetical protein
MKEQMGIIEFCETFVKATITIPPYQKSFLEHLCQTPPKRLEISCRATKSKYFSSTHFSALHSNAKRLSKPVFLIIDDPQKGR